MLKYHFPFPIWNFDEKKIELCPEKWEMGFKQGFSRLKCSLLDCKRESNVGIILAQWLEIYQSRTFQDSLFSTLRANLAIGMPELQISISLIASGREMMVLDYLNALDLPTKDFP